MELRDEVQRIGARSYVFTGVFVSKHFTCKDFAELNILLPDIEQQRFDRHLRALAMDPAFNQELSVDRTPVLALEPHP